jgi:hypothetical protein
MQKKVRQKSKSCKKKNKEVISPQLNLKRNKLMHTIWSATISTVLSENARPRHQLRRYEESTGQAAYRTN